MVLPVKVQFIADQTPVNQRGNVIEWDDFRGGGVNGLGWEVLGTSPQVTQTTGTNDHPGVLRLTTKSSSPSSGDIAAITRYRATEDRLALLEWIFQPQHSTSAIYRLGAATGLTLVGMPTDGIAVEYNTGVGDTALALVTYVAGARAVGATLPLDTAHWYRLNWSRIGSGAGTLALTDIDAATSASYDVSGLTPTSNWESGAYVQTLTASVRTLEVDWFRAALVGMVR